jgi:hypothetical protein
MKLFVAAAVAALLALSCPDVNATVRETVSFNNVNSNGLLNNASNTVVVHPLTGGYALGRVRFSGSLVSVNANTHAADAHVLVTAPNGATFTFRPFVIQGLFSTLTFDQSMYVPGVTSAAGPWTFRFYEIVDNGGPSGVDARWTMSIQFTDELAVPPAATDLGAALSPGLTIPDTTVGSAGYLLYKLTVNRAVSVQSSRFLDLTAATTGTARDTEMVLFSALGEVLASDDDSGPELAAQMSFGSGTRPPLGDGEPFDGRNGSLDAGIYYLALGNYDLTATGQPWGLAFSGGQTQTALTLVTNIEPGIDCPAFSSPPVSLSVPIGQPVILVAGASGGSPLTYRWTRDGTDLSDSPSVSGTTTQRLVLGACTAADSGLYRLRVTNACGQALSEPGDVRVVCHADFDGDGDTGTDADIEAFFACLAGTCCATCGSADFNADGDTGTDADIESFFRVLAGGPC